MSSQRLTLAHLQYQVLNLSGFRSRSYSDTKIFLCKIPRFNYMEWLVEPAGQVEKEQILKDDEIEQGKKKQVHEIQIYNKFKKREGWSKVIFEQLIPEVIFCDTLSLDELSQLHRAAHKINRNFPDKFLCFLHELKKFESWIWMYLIKQELFNMFIYDVKKILSTAKQSLDDGGSSELVLMAHKELNDALDDQILKWRQNWKQSLCMFKDEQANKTNIKNGKKSTRKRISGSPDWGTLQKVLLREWSNQRGKKEADYIYDLVGEKWKTSRNGGNLAKNIAEKIISLINDDLDKTYLISNNEPSSHANQHYIINLLDNETNLLNIMPQLMLYNRLFDDQSNKLITYPCSAEYKLPNDFKKQVASIVNSVQTKIKHLGHLDYFVMVWENRHSLALIDDLAQFIEYYKDDCGSHNNLLDFIACNECGDDLKCAAFGELLRCKNVPWQEVFKSPENIKKILIIIKLGWADEKKIKHYFEDLKKIIGHTVGKCNSNIETLIVEKKEVRWLPFLEPDVIADTLNKSKEYKKDLAPWYNVLLDMLRNGWGGMENDLIARAYCRYWEYGFENIVELRNDLTILYWYYRYGGKHDDIQAWLQQEQVQGQFYNTCTSVLAAPEMNRMAELAGAYLMEGYRDRLVIEIRSNILKAAFNTSQDNLVDISNFSYWLKELGYELIGLTAENKSELGDRMRNDINKYPQRFEFEAEVVFIPGIHYLYNIVKPGLVETNTGRVLVRAVIRPEVEDEEVLDNLFNELKNI